VDGSDVFKLEFCAEWTENYGNFSVCFSARWSDFRGLVNIEI
jgi:hypothetical protein